MQLWWTCTTGN